MLDLSVGATFNPAAWVLHHNITNENGSPIDFRRHKFLLDFYMDESKEIVAKKCSQIGFSTTAILKSLHLAKYRKANIIYLLPSKSVVKDFVSPKVDPLIATNPAIKEIMGTTDNLGLKSVGTGKDQRFIYFRSSWDEASGIAISAHVLVADENDRSNQKAIDTYKTRLDAALLDRPDLGFMWRFSNPIVEGYGTDKIYQESDAKVWMVKCGHCNFYQNLKFPENINFDTKEYVCIKCHRTLTTEDRTRGHWVKKYFGRTISGYHINQLIAPWIPASKIIKDSLGDQSIFYNFTLGLAYTSKDIQITREAITKCLYPTANPMTDVAIGVDNGITKHYVCMNKYGVFRIGSTDDWVDIENLRNQYNAYMVIDSNPYPTPVNKLVAKYQGKVFAHFYDEDAKEAEIIRFLDGDKQGTVHSDRTKIIDSVVADINSQDLLFNMSLTVLENEGFIAHCLNEYRVVEESAKGIKRGVWKCVEGKPDHFLHALCVAGNTPVLTIKGEKQIKDIQVGEMVLTRRGYKKVVNSWMTRQNVEVVKVIFSNGKSIIATPDHKVWIKNKGFVALHTIVYGDIIETCPMVVNLEKLQLARNPVLIVKYRRLKKREDVYNISVEDQHEYYANGILVANCYAKVALQQTLSVGGVAHTPPPRPKQVQSPVYVQPDGQVIDPSFDFDKLKQQLGKPKPRSWRQL